MGKNLAILHGGGPTCVINASLYGAVKKAQDWGELGHIYGVLGGIDGLFSGRLSRLENLPDSQLKKLLKTPGSVLGTSRRKIVEEEYVSLREKLHELNIGYLVMTGGNGTMKTAARLAAAAPDIHIVGVPKTVDNDIPETDHCPGYGSAARFVAVSTRELGFDLQSMPNQVVILETMGRNAGWLAAAAALGEPNLIYFPERAFDENEFLHDVEQIYHEEGRVLAVVAEGLRDAAGKTVVPPILKRGRDVYFDHISAYLARLVIEKLGIKARGEKPGLLGRASVALQSEVDRNEAVEAGSSAVQALMNGKSTVMAGCRRVREYSCEPVLIPLDQVGEGEKKLPDRFIRADGKNVTQEFLTYVTPLVGKPVAKYGTYVT